MSDIPPLPASELGMLSRPELVEIVRWYAEHQQKLNDEITVLRTRIITQAEEHAAAAEERRLTLLNLSAQLDRFHAQALDCVHQRDVMFNVFKMVVQMLQLIGSENVPDRLSPMYHVNLSRAKEVVAHIERLKRS